MPKLVVTHIEGLRELDRALSELPKATAKAALKRMLTKRAEPIADAMRANAPDDPTSEGKSDLRTSIGVSTKLSKRQGGLQRKAAKDDKAFAEVYVGAGALPQAHLQEFGSSVHGPQPFARPAWDANKTAVLDGLKKDLWSEIERAAKRLAKKAAKAALIK